MNRVLLVITLTLALAAPAVAQQPLVQLVRDRGGWDFRTKAGLCAYSNAVVVALHAADPAYGHLSKSEGQNHCVDPIGRNVAVDAAFYKPTGQAFDFIGSAGYGDPPPENKVWWGTEDPVGKYAPADWLEPVAGAPVPPPVVTPPPVVVIPPPVVVVPPPVGIPSPVTAPPVDLNAAALAEIKALATEAVQEIKAHRAAVSREYYKWAAILGPILTGLFTWMQLRAAKPL